MSDGTFGRDADPGGFEPDWAVDEMLTPVARALEAVGASDDAFSLVSIDGRQGVVRVHRVGALAPNVAAMYRRVAPQGVPVLFVDSVLSVRQRTRLTELVSEQQSWLSPMASDWSSGVVTTVAVTSSCIAAQAT